MKKKAGNQDIWSEFYGQKNNKDLLIKKALSLALLMFSSPYTAAENLEKGTIGMVKDLKLTERSWADVRWEFLFLFLNLIDRDAFVFLEDKDDRELFMNKLLSGLLSIFAKSFGTEDKSSISSIEDKLRNEYNNHQQKYSTYKNLFPKGDESPVNTVFWEFGKSISEMISDTDKDIRIIMLAYMEASSSILTMEVPQLLTGRSIKDKN